jgi:3'(2'), 5'-bisphosphate nucleotidase
MMDVDDDLATVIARSTGQLLLHIRSDEVLNEAELGRTGDAVAHHYLVGGLRAHRPNDAIRSEEGEVETAPTQSDRLWIIDPLDGTREYSEGRADWAVHVALTVRGEPTAAAVALPGLDIVLSTASPLLVPPLDGRLRIAVSRSRPPDVARVVAAKLGGEIVPMGSAGYKAMAVVRGEVHAYIHAGGQYEWDSAAPVGVALHAGLFAGALDGTVLPYGKLNPWSPELLVCRPEITSEILSAIAEFNEV